MGTRPASDLPSMMKRDSPEEDEAEEEEEADEAEEAAESQRES